MPGSTCFYHSRNNSWHLLLRISLVSLCFLHLHKAGGSQHLVENTVYLQHEILFNQEHLRHF